MRPMPAIIPAAGTTSSYTSKAAKGAINSPLLDVDIKGCTGLLINIVGDDSLTMHEVNTAANIISGSAHEGANIIFGANIDREVDGIKVTVIATGFYSDFRSVKLPSESIGIKNEDVLSQIDSRFDQIQKAQSSNTDDNTDDDDDDNNMVKKSASTIKPTPELNPMDDYRDNSEEFGGFDFDKMRAEVEEMEKDERKSSGNFFDDDFDTQPVKEEPKPVEERHSQAQSTAAKRIKPSPDVKSSGLWRFIKERSK